MWLKIRLFDNAVVGTNYASLKPLLADTEIGTFEYKEWLGAEPILHEPEQGIESYDPTMTDPNYPALVEARAYFDDLAERADAEVTWLVSIIPTITDPVVKRMAQENLQMIRAWRYILRRLK